MRSSFGKTDCKDQCRLRLAYPYSSQELKPFVDKDDHLELWSSRLAKENLIFNAPYDTVESTK